MTQTRQKSPQVLAVDPDPALRNAINAEFGADSWRIEHKENGTQGLAQIESRAYDVAVLEINLQGTNGMELFDRIRESRPDTRVILVAEQSTPEEIVRALRGRAFAYVSKPFSPAVLADFIRRAIGTRSWQKDIEVASARPEWVSVELSCKLEVVERLLPFIRALQADLPEHDREDGITAFREVLMNAVEHGGGSDPKKRVRASYVRTARAVIYYIGDPGSGFSFDRLPHAAISNPPDSPLGHHQVRSEMGIRPGGFGILLTRSLVDDVIYNEAGNEVLVVKYINP